MIKMFAAIGFGLLAGTHIWAEEPATGSLQWYAAKAKADGKTSLRIHPPIGIPVELRELSQALQEYMIVVATPTAKALDTRIDERLLTWYKLRIEETWKAHPRPDEFESISPPDRMFPFKQNEIAVCLAGGAATVDGIDLSAPFTPIKELTLGDRYVFFMIPYNSRRSALLQAQEDAVFKISSDGQLIPHGSPRSDRKELTLFQKDLLSRTAANVASLRVIVSEGQ